MKKLRSISKTGLPDFENEIAKLRVRVEALETNRQLKLDPDFYIAFENRFRGPFDIVKERVSVYVDDLKHLANSKRTVVDIGCGRGEMLTVLRESGIHAIGVDNNPLCITSLQERGFEASCEDLSDFLERTPDSSLPAITMLHVVEHLPFDLLLSTFQQVFRVLEPGGILIAETPNSLNLTVGSSTFWIDPTHQKPLHPEVLRFLSDFIGFMHTEIRYLHGTGAEAYDVCLVSKKQL